MHLFGSTQSLPQVPQSPLRLTALLDDPDPSPREIEDVIHSDPALTAGVVKAASSAVFGRSRPATSVREATLVLGNRSLRSLAVAMWTNSLVCDASHKSRLDLKRFAKNGSYVGATASFLSRNTKDLTPPVAWTPEELYAAGVLHNVLFGLLSFTDPQEFDRIYELAERHKTSLRHTFLAVHEHPIGTLAARASEALGLPGQFLTVAENIEDPTASEFAPTALTILHVARSIAEADTHGLEHWPLDIPPSGPVARAFSPDEQTIAQAVAFARTNLVLAA